MTHNSKFIILAKRWITPFIIAMALFAIVQPALAQTVAVSNPTSVGIEAVDGYTQVYFEGRTGKKFITSGNINSRMPVFAGAYVSYVSDINGAGQVFLYDLVSNTKTQLTFLSTNLNPKIDDKGRVAWEGWTGGKWQIFLFDGKSITQLTSGDTGLNPDISGEYVSFGRRDITGTWRAVIYSIAEGKSVDVAIGENTKNPKIVNGDIYLDYKTSAEEKFPLSIADLFLLNLKSLSQATPSGDLILNELTATQSAVVEIPLASQSATPNSQSTSSGQLSSSPTPGIPTP